MEYNDIQFLRNKNFGIAKEMPQQLEDITGLYCLIYEEEESILSYCDMTPESRKCAVREA
jgi:hypothetical protein